MPVKLGNEKVPVTCPKCGSEFKERLSRFEAKAIAICPKCHEGIPLGLSKPGELRDAQRQIDNLGKSLKNLFKK